MKELSMEEKVQYLWDINEIQKVMGRYSFLHTAGMHRECVDLFATKTPGLRIEMAWGIYEGPNAAERCYVVDHINTEGQYGDEARKGQMHIHTLTTPVIEIAGDGKTAKGVWVSPGVESAIIEGKAEANWGWCKYGVDFVKEDSQWKIWHLHVYGIFFTPYDVPWTEAKMPDWGADMFQRSHDKPPTAQYEYAPDKPMELAPAPPEPYETFDETTAY